MKKVTIQLESLVCPSCTQKIEASLKKTEGVDNNSIKVLYNASKVRLNFDSNKVEIKEIEESISKLGFEVIKSQVRNA